MEVAPGVLWLRLPLPMALDHVNAWALDEGEGWTLVDPGMDTPACRATVEGLLAGPLAGKPVRRVIVTHHHPDHVGLAGLFVARGAELLMPRTGWLYARMLCLDAQERPDAATLAFWKGAGMPAGMLAERAGRCPYNFADRVAPLPLGYTRLAEGDAVQAGGRRWRVRTGEGHAPEHAVLFSEDDNLVLGGDQLLPGISANLSVHASEPDADPLRDWLQSCARFASLAREEHLVLPGHKLPFTGLPWRLEQMIQSHEAALARLRAFLAEAPRAAVDCFPVLFRRQVGPDVYDFALNEAMAHLNYLLHRGEARRETDAGGVWRWLPAE